MKYTDGNVIIEAFKWTGEVLVGDEERTPSWVKDAIWLSHTIWFDSAWNMKVRTSSGEETYVKPCDYLIKDTNGIKVMAHNDFKEKYRKVQ